MRVVLSHTTHPGNIGAAARAMKTMGLEMLYLVNPSHFPDVQADTMACGAEDVLRNAVVCSSIDEALHGTIFVAAMTARLRDISHEVLTPRDAMPLLAQHATQGEAEVAVWVGWTVLVVSILTIAVTRAADAELLIELINEAQIYRFLSKPVNQEQLVRHVEAALNRYHAYKATPELTRVAQKVETAKIAEPQLSSRLLDRLRALRNRFNPANR